MRTFTMSLGEFDFGDYSEMFRREAGPTRRNFAMILLVSLILFVSLTIYQLFIAVLISDVKDLQDAVYIQVGVLTNRHRGQVSSFNLEHLQHDPALLHGGGDIS